MPGPCTHILRLLLAVALPCAASAFPATRAASAPPVRGSHGMVVSAEANASQAGIAVLQGGGNAVDAAVAVAFALAVSFPEAGNLGGGGFLLLRRSDGAAFALDFRETAPGALTPGMFLDENGRAVPQRSVSGGLAVGVPGSVAGLWEAHSRWGSRPWASLLEPAIRMARQGVRVSRREAEELAGRAQDLSSDPGARLVFTRGGKALREGDLLVQKDLARTLQRIARLGPRGFYEGPVAESIVRTVGRAGGVLTDEDLASYRPVVRAPLEGSYRGQRVLTFPPPSGGGVLLLQVLGMLESFDLRASGAGSSSSVHLVAEAERRAFADRSRWLGDPAFVRVPVEGLLASDYVRSRAATIRPDRATPSDDVAPGSPAGAPEREETTHYAVADAQGNVVGVTTTLNSSFGAALLAEGTGVLLNNEIDDFALAPGVPNQFGLTGSAANRVGAGKRPLSSMCPTIVLAPEAGARPILVLGSPGGSTIVSAVLEVLVNVLDHGMGLQEAVDAPRFHHQWLPDRIDHEVRAFPEDVARALGARGHTLKARPPIGYVPAIGVDSSGAWLGAADPRRGGLAVGY